ncbi:MAG: 6-pyruvoyl-tetrahydropterin synthase-related protein [Candidatus Acidiferrales bacterium]
MRASRAARSIREWRKRRMILYSLKAEPGGGGARHEKLNAPQSPEKAGALLHERPQNAAAAGSGRTAFLLVAIAATAVVAPMLLLSNASGHDLQFHVASWMEVANQWRQGIIYPRWAEWANWGFGEPRFIFYPPASWMMGAALGVILPWRVVPGVFIWLALVLAGICMWHFAREWLLRHEAILAAVIYAVNPYHLVIVYFRSDFAELLASALFPLVLYGSLRVVREGWRGWPWLAVPFAAVWLSNAPAGVLASYSLALIFLVLSVLRRSARPLFTGGMGMAAGFGLAAFYILPAAWEQRWVQIHQVIMDTLHPAQNFLFTHGSDPEFVFFNWKISAVALLVTLAVAIAAVFVSRRRREFPQLWWALLALGFAAILLMFPASAIFWRLLPKLEFLQFPWRWLGPLDFVLAIFVAVALGSVKRQWICWIFVVLILGSLGAVISKDAWWDSEDIPFLANSIQAGFGYEGTDEYQPLGSDRYELPGTDANGDWIASSPAPDVRQYDASIGNGKSAAPLVFRIQRWAATHRSFSAQASAPTMIAVRLLAYPGWQVQVDGATSTIAIAPKTGEMLLALPAGTHQLNIDFRNTWDRITGALISLMFAVAFLVFVLQARLSQRNRARLNSLRKNSTFLGGRSFSSDIKLC